MAYVEDDFTWCQYTSDWQAETFARKVRRSVVAVAALGWTADAGVGDNAMPQACKVRLVHIVDDHDTAGSRTPTGQRLSLPIADPAAAVYSTAGTPPVLTYKGTAFTIAGFSGEVRTLPRAG